MRSVQEQCAFCFCCLDFQINWSVLWAQQSETHVYGFLSLSGAYDTKLNVKMRKHLQRFPGVYYKCEVPILQSVDPP